MLLFLLLLPYVCSLLFGRGEASSAERFLGRREEGILVVCREETGERVLPLETYVAGALAASIPISCGEETLKAQAVILRTMCLWNHENKGDVEDSRIAAQDMGQEYLGEEELRRAWGAAYEENREKLDRAVSATEGIYMTYEGKPMEPAYFWLSAGSTRDGVEVLGEGYGYLKSVDCGHDMEAEAFASSQTLGEERFWERLGMPEQASLSLVRDSAGYVLWAETEEGRISGEKMRSLLSLPSACFTIRSEGGQVEITCKGVGHGLGFCQHEADRRAAQGTDYLTLLETFFQDVEMEKIAE